MGMDVHGIDPKDKRGEYFRANVWSWRPIHAIMGIVNTRNGDTLIDAETMDQMANNDGAGLKDQKSCDRLADAVDAFIADSNALREAGFVVNRNDHDPEEINISFPLVEGDNAVTDGGSFVQDDELATMTAEQKAKLRSPYGTSYSHVRAFVKFLRSCGGFSVH